MYSLIFKQIQTCCSRAAVLVDRGDEGQDTIRWLPFEGSVRKTWRRLTSTVLIPESKPIWAVCPITTINQKNDFKSEQKVGVHQTSGSREVTTWSFCLREKHSLETIFLSGLDYWIPVLAGPSDPRLFVSYLFALFLTIYNTVHWDKTGNYTHMVPVYWLHRVPNNQREKLHCQLITLVKQDGLLGHSYYQVKSPKRITYFWDTEN